MIENTELGRVFSLFFEKDIYLNNISSLIATNDSIDVNFNLSKCNYSETQLTVDLMMVLLLVVQEELEILLIIEFIIMMTVVSKILELYYKLIIVYF